MRSTEKLGEPDVLLPAPITVGGATAPPAPRAVPAPMRRVKLVECCIGTTRQRDDGRVRGV